MEPVNSQKITNEISAYIKNTGGLLSNWYVGIASNVEDRLFVDHNVSRDSGAWAFNWALSEIDARQAEKALLNWGCDGGAGGGSNATVYVYAFWQTPTTVR